MHTSWRAKRVPGLRCLSPGERAPDLGGNPPTGVGRRLQRASPRVRAVVGAPGSSLGRRIAGRSSLPRRDPTCPNGRLRASSPGARTEEGGVTAEAPLASGPRLTRAVPVASLVAGCGLALVLQAGLPALERSGSLSDVVLGAAAPGLSLDGSGAAAAAAAAAGVRRDDDRAPRAARAA